MRSKTAVLLLNVGTPENPTNSGVRKFLSEFLNDKRVIGIPWLLRKLLVNLIIVPFRTRKSARRYRQLWNEKGSPLLYHGLALRDKLELKLGEDYIIMFATAYGRTGIGKMADKLSEINVGRIIGFPLFPQYASSATGAVFEKLLRTLARQYVIPPVITIDQYYNDIAYLEAVISRISEYNYSDYDHILMSFHGLPLKQVRQSHNGIGCDHYNCINEINRNNVYCYQAVCYETSRLIANMLKLESKQYSVSFQSRFSENWLTPFTDEIVIKLAKEGKKQLLVICPSFTADCLETIIEIGRETRDLFIRHGGTKLTLVESLNDSDSWVDAISKIVLQNTGGAL